MRRSLPRVSRGVRSTPIILKSYLENRINAHNYFSEGENKERSVVADSIISSFLFSDDSIVIGISLLRLPSK
ncbi:hypothetical protein Xedl_02852 [Xenorhabdus eapokensis]|uniref:Uncharacterized protein n=1 Tax=Xenorhabdus eapokensis TaxID=1873482 RepID=A0A1Q5TMX4_9GAMM|nr:hypothetical protein Xedl_02852 [Xenorhabdus eapokensis]